MSFEQKIATTLKQKIKSSGVTMDWVAKKMPTNRSSLSRKLGGKQAFDLETIEGCCRCLDIKVEDFFRELTFKETTPQVIERSEMEIIFKNEINFLVFILTQKKMPMANILSHLQDYGKSAIKNSIKELLYSKIISLNANMYINRYAKKDIIPNFTRSNKTKIVLEKLARHFIEKTPVKGLSSEKDIREWEKKNKNILIADFFTEEQVEKIKNMMEDLKMETRSFVIENRTKNLSQLSPKMIFLQIFGLN